MAFNYTFLLSLENLSFMNSIYFSSIIRIKCVVSCRCSISKIPFKFNQDSISENLIEPFLDEDKAIKASQISIKSSYKRGGFLSLAFPTAFNFEYQTPHSICQSRKSISFFLNL